jgi:hypothetical protein
MLGFLRAGDELVNGFLSEKLAGQGVSSALAWIALLVGNPMISTKVAGQVKGKAG